MQQLAEMTIDDRIELKYWKLPPNRPLAVIALLEEYAANPGDHDVDAVALELRRLFSDLFNGEAQRELRTMYGY